MNDHVKCPKCPPLADTHVCGCLGLFQKLSSAGEQHFFRPLHLLDKKTTVRPHPTDKSTNQDPNP